MYIRSCLLVAVGAAAGILATTFSPRPADPPHQPVVDVRTSHVEADGTVRTLRPMSIRVGDQITRVGEPDPERRDRALVYLDVNGERVIVALEVEPAPAGPPSPSSGISSRPTPVGGVGLGVAPRLDS